MLPLLLPALVALGETPAATVAAFVKAFNENDGAALAREIEGGVVSPSPINPSRAILKATVAKTTLADDDAYLELNVEFEGAGLGVGGGSGHETIHLRRREGEWRVVPPSVMAMPNLSTIALYASNNSVVQQARSAARSTACLSNVKQLATATIIYASDHDDVLPKDASRWREAIMPYAKNPEVFRCPEDASGSVSYFFDGRLAGKSMTAIASPAETAMIVEGSPKQPTFRHQGRASLGFVDGHAKLVRPEVVTRARTTKL